jgi:two-component system chemotaxis sensor kinase CheA
MREEMKQTEAKETGAAGTSMSLRVNIGLLDTLMNLAGELVLGRNQLLQGLGSANAKATELSSQRIDMITSELQEAIMRTRMQPIGHILNKLSPMVSDLAQTLEKTIDLTLEGTDVELDKTILETINDPLIHLIRNSADHGIEMPEERSSEGKATCGKIAVKAFHEAGQVNISISDDGRGLDPEKLAASAISKGLIDEQTAGSMTKKQKMELIFMSGFSTADEITKISGHGIGMDVVTNNIENLGGVIELDSEPGKGTNILIKLPLTLAIIPSQITVVGNERYAIPQVNLNELLRIPAAKIKERIKRVGDAEVVRLRGELLPLLDLSKILGIEKKDHDPETSEEILDRGSPHYPTAGYVEETTGIAQIRRDSDARRHSRANVVNIAVVSAGVYKYCLVVDELQDSEEIVVKPIGRHLNQYSAYAGATIMGDGKVALILDIANLGQIAELETVNQIVQPVLEQEKGMGSENNRVSLLTFKNTASEHLAMPMSLVERIERFKASDIETIGSEKVVQYRGGALPLFEMSQVCGFDSLPAREYQEVIVFRVKDKELGLMVSPPVDTIETVLGIKETTLKQKGISGSMIIKERTTLLVDIFEMMEGLKPDWFAQDEFRQRLG